jgi:hypothetical protein
MWGVHVEKDHEPKRHRTVEKMVERLQAAVQTRLRKAYNAVGGGRFKPDTTEADFSFEHAGNTLAANPREVWGEELASEEWRLQQKWEWPAEPAETAIPSGDNRLKGIEVEEEATQEEMQERERDRAKWKAEGMQWIDGFTHAGRKKVLRFLHENEMAMMSVMDKSNNKGSKKFGKVEDVRIETEEYRPGARGKLWVWENGIGRELTAQKIDKDVNFNVPHVMHAATTTGFRDARGLQMLTEWGATHGTEAFPLHSYGARNHQGAATQTAALTAMM